MNIVKGSREVLDAAGDTQPGTRNELDRRMGWFTLAVAGALIYAFKGQEIVGLVGDQLANMRSLFDLVSANLDTTDAGHIINDAPQPSGDIGPNVVWQSEYANNTSE